MVSSPENEEPPMDYEQAHDVESSRVPVSHNRMRNRQKQPDKILHQIHQDPNSLARSHRVQKKPVNSQHKDAKQRREQIARVFHHQDEASYQAEQPIRRTPLPERRDMDCEITQTETGRKGVSTPPDELFASNSLLVVHQSLSRGSPTDGELDATLVNGRNIQTCCSSIYDVSVSRPA